MYINAAILAYLTYRRDRAFTSFKSEYPLFNRLVGQLQAVDTDQVKDDFHNELVGNCQQYWVNSPELVRGILFEYGQLISENVPADAYGITFGDFKVQAEPYSFNDTEIADQFYALPGVTLSPLSPLLKLENEPLEPRQVGGNWVYDDEDLLPERKKLTDAYVFTTYIGLHHALAKFVETSTFKMLNRRSPFYFLIEEHDRGATYPVYVAE